MSWLFTILGLLALVVIGVQDFKERRFLWWLPVLAAVSFSGLYVMDQGWNIWLASSGMNLVLMSVQAAVIYGWYWFRYKRNGVAFRKVIGLGDVVLVAALLLAMSPLNFMLHYLVGLTVSVVIAIVFRIAFNQSQWKIPLAGIMAVCYGALLVLNQVIDGYSWYRDNWWVG